MERSAAALIGREAELHSLDDARAKAQAGEAGRPRVETFVALGGEGETSLVARCAAELEAKGWPGAEATFACSFYSQGTRDQLAASSDLFFFAALEFFDVATDEKESGYEKGRRLARALSERRALLILDGLEPLQHAPTAPDARRPARSRTTASPWRTPQPALPPGARARLLNQAGYGLHSKAHREPCSSVSRPYMNAPLKPASAGVTEFPRGDAALKKTEAAPIKDLYEMGEIPPLGHVPKNMYAWVVRKERHGPPEDAMKLEVVPTWELDSHDVLVLVMAAGVNYNGVWAALGQPISVLDAHRQPYHIAGSDASGVVWAVGSKVKRWKVGDEVVIHCNQDDGDDEECNGGDPMFSASQRIWGYETPDGSFAQFCRVQDRQLMERPKHLTWEESACYTLTLATAYRMLFGHEPHRLKPSDNVLIWGASGGLGVFGVQLCAAAGANAIGVISDESKRDYVMSLGAKGVINRKDFKGCWGQLPTVNTPEFNEWTKAARGFGKAIWDITGKKDVDIVFEHPGEQTFPLSCLVVKRGGMVVFCAGTTGFNLTFDARYVWMRQKRIQGSHFAHLKQAAAANRFVIDRRVDPCMSEVFPWDKIPLAHTKMWKNEHAPGNMAVLVNAPTTGLRTVEDVIEAGKNKG